MSELMLSSVTSVWKGVEGKSVDDEEIRHVLRELVKDEGVVRCYWV